MSRYLRLRMENCVATILEIKSCLGQGQISPEIVRQFERLKTVLGVVSEDRVDEEDIGRIEEATNQLLDEIRVNMDRRSLRFKPDGWIN